MNALRICLLFSILIGLGVVSCKGQSYQLAADQLVNDPDLGGARISLCVVDLETNQLLAQYQPHQMLKPASSLKLLTTSSALMALGADYRFKTELRHSGYVDGQGVLHGHLYLQGYGDPTLGSDQWEKAVPLDPLLEAMTRAVQEAGIQSVSGGVLSDPHWFQEEPVPLSWAEKDLGNYYAAGAWGLNIHENLFYLPFRQNSQAGGQPGILAVRPPIEGLQFINEVRAQGASDNAYIYKGPYEYRRPVRGTIPPGSGIFTIKGAMPDPPLHAAQLLTEQLEKAGIPVQAKAAVKEPQDRALPPTVLWTHFSPPLSEIVARANQESVNLYCEVLLKALGKQCFGAGLRAEGVLAVRQIWKDRGLDLSAAVLADGSGLSQENQLSAAQLTGIVRKAALDPHTGIAFRSSLAVAGRTGTLAGTLKGTAAEGRIWGKTGSMKGVRSYTGLARNRAGKEVAFSVIVNDYACSVQDLKRALERWMLSLCQ